MEWNLLTGQPRSKFNANAAIWDSQLQGKLLYLACEDGSIKLVKIKKDSLVLHKQMAKMQSRCLSICLLSESLEFFASYADGSILKWDIKQN